MYPVSVILYYWIMSAANAAAPNGRTKYCESGRTESHAEHETGICGDTRLNCDKATDVTANHRETETPEHDEDTDDLQHVNRFSSSSVPLRLVGQSAMKDP